MPEREHPSFAATRFLPRKLLPPNVRVTAHLGKRFKKNVSSESSAKLLLHGGLFDEQPPRPTLPRDISLNNAHTMSSKSSFSFADRSSDSQEAVVVPINISSLVARSASNRPPSLVNSENIFKSICLYYDGKRYEIPWVTGERLTLSEAVNMIRATDKMAVGGTPDMDTTIHQWFRSEPLELGPDENAIPEHKRARRYCCGNIDVMACPNAWANYTPVPDDDPVWLVLKRNRHEIRRACNYDNFFTVYLTVNTSRDINRLYNPRTFVLYSASYDTQQIRSFSRYRLKGSWRFYADPYCNHGVLQHAVLSKGLVLYARLRNGTAYSDLCAEYSQLAQSDLGHKLVGVKIGDDPAMLPGLGDVDEYWGWKRPSVDAVRKVKVVDRLDEEKPPEVKRVGRGFGFLHGELMLSESFGSTKKPREAANFPVWAKTTSGENLCRFYKTSDDGGRVRPIVIESDDSSDGSLSSNLRPDTFSLGPIVDEHELFSPTATRKRPVRSYGRNVHSESLGACSVDVVCDAKKVRRGGAPVLGPGVGETGADAEALAADHQVGHSGVDESGVSESSDVRVKEFPRHGPVVIASLRGREGGQPLSQSAFGRYSSDYTGAYDL